MFNYLSKDTAPVESTPLIERSMRSYGFLPKLHAILAESPATYKAYLDTFELFENGTTLSPLERQIVFQISNYENNCSYCMPGHTFLMKLAKMPDPVIEALREGNPLEDKRLEALRLYTQRLLRQKGHLSESEINEFFDAGYTRRQSLEVLVGLASKLLSNFTNALARTELDDPVKKYAWTHPNLR